MNSPKQFFFDLFFSEFSSLLSSSGEPDYRSIQIWLNVYRLFKLNPSSFTNISKSLRTRLSETLEFSHLESRQELFSNDCLTRKILFRLPSGNAIETVLMQSDHRETVCISTQVGCSIGCIFCATGQLGFQQNLSTGEIVEQVIQFARILQTTGKVLTNVVIMGMGEPFLNYENTLKAISILTDPNGLNLGHRHFTISTVGIIPGINKFTAEKSQVNLAISLHAANDDLRNKLIPINRIYPLRALMEACWNYVRATRRRLTFEWALINDVNDHPDDAHQLASLLKGMLCHVNLIQLNPTLGYACQPSTRQKSANFKVILTSKGIPCTIRMRRGIDIQAGCGQLAARQSS